MIDSKGSLWDILEIIQNDKRLNLYKYEVVMPQSKIIFIDVIPKTKDFAQTNTSLQNVCHATIMIAPMESSQNKKDEDIQWVRRSSTIMRELYLPEIFGKNQSQAFCKSIQLLYGLENVVSILRKKKQVQIIKTGWPHGITIQVSYLPHYKGWIVSEGKRSRLVLQNNSTLVEKDAQSANDKLDIVVNCWIHFLETTKSRQQIKAKLCSRTIIGKIIRNCKQIIFHTVVCNKNGTEFDPFQAREYLQKLGLKYVPIKSLGIFNSQQSLQNCLMKSLNSIRCEFSQSINYSNGRSKLFFVCNDGSFIGGVNVSTNEDLLLQQMKRILLITENISVKNSLFEDLLEKMKITLPYPMVSYQQLFKNLHKLKQILSLNANDIELTWFQIIKLSLYMHSKRISFEKYAKVCYEKKTLDLISEIPLQEFGPIQSKIILIYYLVHPSMQLKKLIAQSLKQSFGTINASLVILGQKINKIEYIQQEIHNSKNHVHNYFIIPTFQIRQLKKLQSNLNSRSKDHYYKLIIINESFKGQTILNQNAYPFSWTSIIDSYLQAYKPIKNAYKIQEKLQQLSKITEEIKLFKNYDIMNLKNRVSINLHDVSQSKQIKKIIESIIISGQRNLYVRFLAQLQRYNEYVLMQEKELKVHVTNILKKSYSSIRTICIKTQ